MAIAAATRTIAAVAATAAVVQHLSRVGCQWRWRRVCLARSGGGVFLGAETRWFDALRCGCLKRGGGQRWWQQQLLLATRFACVLWWMLWFAAVVVVMLVLVVEANNNVLAVAARHGKVGRR